MFKVDGKNRAVVDALAEDEPMFFLDRGENCVGMASLDYLKDLAHTVHHEPTLDWEDWYEKLYIRVPGSVGLQEVRLDIVEKRDRPGTVVHARNKLTGIAMFTWDL